QLDLLVVEKQVGIDALKEQATWRCGIVVRNRDVLAGKIAEPGTFRLLNNELGAAGVALDGLGQVRQAQALVFRDTASLTLFVESHEFIHEFFPGSFLAHWLAPATTRISRLAALELVLLWRPAVADLVVVLAGLRGSGR